MPYANDIFKQISMPYDVPETSGCHFSKEHFSILDLYTHIPVCHVYVHIQVVYKSNFHELP